MIEAPLSGELLDAVYDTALDQEAWRRVLPMLAANFQGDAATFRLVNDRRQTASILSTRTDESLLQSYVTHYHTMDFVTELSRSGSSGAVFAFQHLLDDERYRQYPQSDEYLEYLKVADCSHVMGTWIALPGGWELRFGLSRGRSQREFTRSEITAFEAVTSHVNRTVRLRTAIDAARPKPALRFDEVSGLLLVVDRNNYVHAITPDVENALRLDRLPFGVEGNRLRARAPIDEPQLARLVAQGTRSNGSGPRSGSFECSWRGTRYRVTTVPISDRGSSMAGINLSEPCVAILVTELGKQKSPGGHSARPANKFERALTPAQAGVMDLLLTGMTLREVAVQRNISLETARFHVKNILKKVGARNQKQLIAMAMSADRVSTP